MGIVGTLLNLWINGWSFTPEVFLGCLASGLASTGTHELVRNLFPRNNTSGQLVNATSKDKNKR